MQFYSKSFKEMCDESKAKLFNYRYDVFISSLGWDIELSGFNLLNHWEKDQFDSDDTIYIYTKDKTHSVNGCARLLPTTSDYLLGSVFPELLKGHPIPKSEYIWELSRFTTANLSLCKNQRTLQCSSESSVELLKQVFSVARSIGAKHLVTVSPVGIERLFRRRGFLSSRLGAPGNIKGYWLVACWIDL